MANPLIRVIDLPGFRHFEDLLLLHNRGETPPEIDDEEDKLSLQTFGITRRDAFNLDGQFQTDHLYDDEAVTLLQRLGLDFSDQNGQPLRCTMQFARQAEAASKGIAGRMPDRSSVGLDRWQSDLEAGAREHMAKRGRHKT